ncbi:hypothetical protein GPL15_25450 [Clostridium sp. MCC353]|uniref:hypothetical protein n=1 Tax=Clostridium sp. MCC353 TaxID=2592646 RepID=UPI001C034AF9|nr:hypothetical protein [Clostridium sp. MCC353]MBT9779821.1 hypothetical protein [Clostridium sp. MCC353]
MKRTPNKANIRKLLLKRLVLPILLLLICAAIFLSIPVRNYLSPRPLNQTDHMEELYDKNAPYITLTADTLYYTGFDYQHNGKLKGHYYYTLNQKRCQFYLLKNQDNQLPQPVLENVTLKGTLDPFDSFLYHSLTAQVAQNLSWTSQELESISVPYLISTIPSYKIRQLVLMAVLAFCALLAVGDIIKNCVLASIRLGGRR